MVKNIKLTYFNLKARGEYSRFVLAYSGVEYQDERIAMDAWPALKDKTPFGKLPMLEYDGKIITSSIGIARFLAREFNIAGNNSMEMAEADEIVDMIVDLFDSKFKLMFEQDETKKSTGLEELLKKKVPAAAKLLEKRICERGGQFLVGNHLTWADLIFFYLATEMTDGATGLKKDTPCLANLVDRVANLPNIKAWMNKRPTGAMPF